MCASDDARQAANAPSPAVSPEAPLDETVDETVDEAVDEAPDQPSEPVLDAAEETADLPDPRTDEERLEELRAQALDPSQPFPEAIAERFLAIPFDPPPESLTRDTHYWVSNENFHHLYKPHIDGHGGIYLGVGTDQNYLMAAWARSPVLFLMDFDEEIRNVHHIYGSIFRRVDTPREFISQWAPANEAEVKAWIAEDNPDEARQAELFRTFEVSRQTIFWRLRTAAERYRELELDTFLTDQDQYAFVRDLWRNGRAFPVRGDLTADDTLVDIAAALEEFDLPMGLIYVSNAEQYFNFTPEYRRNLSIQPYDEDSLILRTRPMRRLGYPEDGEYHYNIQGGQNFAEWLTTHRILNVGRLMIGYKTDDPEVEGLSFIRRSPRPSERPPEVAQ